MTSTRYADASRLLSAAALTLALTLTASSVHASNITVTTTDDEINSDGDCSLREAIIAANSDLAVDACPAGAGADTIVLAATSYILSIPPGSNDEQTGDLDILDDLTLTGAGKAKTTIDGAGLDRVFYVGNSTVTFSKLMITGGSPLTDGGGMLINASSVTVVDSRVTNNDATNGGGFTLNAASSLTVLRTRIDANTAYQAGGGIFNSGQLTLTDSPVNANTALWGAGGIETSGTALIQGSLLSGNISIVSGGGISIDGGTANILRSTLSGNTARFHGGGIYAGSGTTGIYNVTVGGNTSDSDGLAGGDGGGVYVLSGATFALQNSIIGENSDLTPPSGLIKPDCAGTLTSLESNIIQNTTYCGISGDTYGNIYGLSPKLGVLKDNGGPTGTRALLAGSPAIDAGSMTYWCSDQNGTPMHVDQRGYAHNSICDIGAFEYLSAGTPTPWPSVTYDDTDPAIIYDANWLEFVEPLDYGGSFHYTGTAGSTASFDFDGTRLTLVFNKVLDRGVMNVAIDGIQVAAIDQFDPGILYQQQWTSGVLSPGPHSLLLTHGGNGTFVDLDAIIVSP